MTSTSPPRPTSQHTSVDGATPATTNCPCPSGIGDHVDPLSKDRPTWPDARIRQRTGGSATASRAATPRPPPPPRPAPSRASAELVATDSSRLSVPDVNSATAVELRFVNAFPVVVFFVSTSGEAATARNCGAAAVAGGGGGAAEAGG